MSLKEYINTDRMEHAPFLSEQYWIKAYLKALRKEEYYAFHRPNKLLRYYHLGKKCVLGHKLNFSINAGNFGPGLRILRYGKINIHPKSRIGSNCTIHGDCYIGSRGPYPDDSPVVGNHVDIGHMAALVGHIRIADGVKIDQEAIVILSILEPNVTVAGIPAMVVKAF